MKRYVVLLLLVGGCLFAYGQKQEVVDVARIVKKEALAVKKFSWGGNRYVFLGDNAIYRLPFKTLRQKTKSPLRGEVINKEGDFVVKGYSVFPDVVCFAKGVVVRANADGIIVDHGNGFESFYGNVLSPVVRVGDKVKKGQMIGRLAQDRELLFGLSLKGTPIPVGVVLDPKTGLETYVGNLYIYNLKGALFVSQNAPMVEFAKNQDALNEEFVFWYKKGVSEHRAKRDFVDDSLKEALHEEINLEDVQIGPAQKQDTVRVRNTISL